jgi:glycosyltransferase involved in cell wall biosynthesis
MQEVIESPTLAHDYLLVMRGAERTFAEMAECWPDAPIATLLYDEAGTKGRFAGRRITTSPLQRLRPTQSNFRRLLPLYPAAATALRPEPSEVVISSSSAFAHGIQTDGVPHVCYCHSPFRYVWHERRLALLEAPRPARPAMGAVLRGMRAWDRSASRGVTGYIANSSITQQRIADFYGRESEVVHPPVDVDRFEPGESEDWYLAVGEVARHKRIEVALEAARRSGRRMKLVGTGPDLGRLASEYSGVADFLGRVDDEELTQLYSKARALVVPNVEEFGIAAVEAQAAGRPVIAADAGGAQETVVEGVTGHRVPVGDVDAMGEAMADVDADAFDTDQIRSNANRFSVQAFRRKLVTAVERAVGRAEPWTAPS